MLLTFSGNLLGDGLDRPGCRPAATPPARRTCSSRVGSVATKSVSLATARLIGPLNGWTLPPPGCWAGSGTSKS